MFVAVLYVGVPLCTAACCSLAHSAVLHELTNVSLALIGLQTLPPF